MTYDKNVIFAYASNWPPLQSNTTGRPPDEKYNVYVEGSDNVLDGDIPIVIMPKHKYEELSVKPNTDEIDNSSQVERDRINYEIRYLEILKYLLEY